MWEDIYMPVTGFLYGSYRVIDLLPVIFPFSCFRYPLTLLRDLLIDFMGYAISFFFLLLKKRLPISKISYISIKYEIVFTVNSKLSIVRTRTTTYLKLRRFVAPSVLKTDQKRN